VADQSPSGAGCGVVGHGVGVYGAGPPWVTFTTHATTQR
jgi:hypothetical protein